MNQTKPAGYAKLLGIIWLAHFVVDFLVGIWPAYKTLAHLELPVAGLIVGISGFLGDGSQIFFGLLSDKGRRTKLILLGIGLAMSASLLAYTSNCILLFLLMLLAYLGSGAFHPAAVAMVGTLIPSRKGTLVTIFASGGSAGLAFSQLIYSKIYHVTDGQTIILMIPAIACLFFVYFKKMSQETTLSHLGKRKLRELFKPLASQRRALTLLYLSQVCQQAVMFAFIFFLPDLLRMNGYGEWVCFGGGHCVFVLSAALMLVPAGYLSDKFSQKKVILLALLLSIVLFYAFLIFPPASTVTVLIFLCCFGACMGVVNPLGVAFGNRIVSGHASVVSALMMGCVWCVAHCFGPASGGLLTCCFDTHAIIKTLGFLGLLFFLAVALTALLPALPKGVRDVLPSDAFKQVA